MNWLDLVLAILLVASIAGGLRSGLVQVVIGFGAAIIGFVAASEFYRPAGAALSPLIASPSVAGMVGFLLIFCAFLILSSILTKIVQGFMKMTGISVLDRLAGGVFGLVRAVLIGSVIILALLAFSPLGPPRAVAGSLLAPYMVEGARLIAYATPASVRTGFEEGYRRLKRYWQGDGAPVKAASPSPVTIVG